MFFRRSALLFSVLVTTASAGAAASPLPDELAATVPDRPAIQELLDTYTRAVSTRNQTLFESLLLNKQIPFAFVGGAAGPNARIGAERNYEAFRKGVFEGAPITQSFSDEQIRQDGALADVTLVFTNVAASGRSRGFKTMQLLKVGGRWKIASEFFTGHRLADRAATAGE
ncbi:hypothetical protein [Rhizosaccharibacter radicis]|uniref:Nuclear transport factor 2 family protein n=1 Tax=Rhizosaccharibacter radicis TaxID=2782605 RepID=A0ABT1W2H3_9PROT|nr:nuclear transport factor 2 family protein [Acetobacteraceae bacterium KSS12]